MSKPRGFTLLEIGIAIALMAMLLALVSTSVNSLTSAEMRKQVGMLQGLIRDTYARTALNGNSHRLVLDLDADAFWVERAEGGAVVGRNLMSTDADGKIEFDKQDERLEGTEDSDDPEDMVKKQLFAGPSWGAVEDEYGKPIQLPGGVRFLSVWVDHLQEAVSAGKVALIFFPGGYMQEAHITLTDDEDGSYTLTLVTQPLTGETFIENDIPDVPVR